MGRLINADRTYRLRQGERQAAATAEPNYWNDSISGARLAYLEGDLLQPRVTQSEARLERRSDWNILATMLV
ncbi:MAG: hypothetical protein U1E24_02495 [Phenylobacterium sp.]|nr:hypothetical protein [Phenylobacterium sp.]